jgi:WD40 repeat protein
MGRQLHHLCMAAMLLLALLVLGCGGKEPDWNNEGVEPIQLGERGSVFSLAFSPDSKYLVVSSEVKERPRFAVWDVASQTEVFLAEGRREVIAVSPDGKTMALSGQLELPPFAPDDTLREYGPPLTLWDTTTWKEKARPAITGVDSVRFLAFHPKEDLLFVAGSRLGDEVLLLWDLKAGKARYRKEPHKFGITAFALSPDGSTLVTGCDTGKVWEAATGKELWSFAGHPSREGANHVSCVAFLPDGATFATGGIDGNVRLWDLKAKKEKAVFSGELVGSEALAVSPDGKVIVVAGYRDGTRYLVEFWEVSTGKRLTKLNVPSVLRVALSPDEKWLATGTAKEKVSPKDRGAVELWKMAEVLSKKSE